MTGEKARKYTLSIQETIDAIELIEGGGASLPRLPIRQWVALCRRLTELGVLGCLAEDFAGVAPTPVTRLVSEWDLQRRKNAVKREELLAAFVREARRNDLHFIVLKGMALSATVYGDPLARQSGDIDVLVDADDIPKADYVARRCGWKQPGEARLARPLRDAGKLTAEVLEDMQAPYALRSNVILPHFTNYYFAHRDGGAESLEIHDRFHGMDARSASNLLWSAQDVELGGERLLTCSDELGLIVSLLSLHEDAETARANTSARSTMGFKACYDAHRQIRRLSVAGGLDNVFDISRSLGVLSMVEESLSDIAEAFPMDAAVIDSSFSRRPSVWRIPYLDRIENPDIRAERGTKLLGELMRDAESDLCAPECVGGRHPLLSVGGSIAADFGFEVREGGDAVKAAWLVPEWMMAQMERFVFQCVVIDAGEGSRIGWRINAFLEDGSWRAVAQPVGPGSVDGHANRASRGREVECAVCGIGSETAVTATLSELAGTEGCRFYASAWERVYGQLHRRVAGEDFAGAVDSALVRASLFAGPYAEYLPELRGMTLFKGMSDTEILLALESMRPPVCEGPLKPPEDGSPHKAFRMVLRTDPPNAASPRRFAYDGQKRGEPGMLMGEVLVLSRKELYLKPTPLSVKPQFPPFEGSMLTLEFTPEMLETACDGKASLAMAKVRRNLMGMLAQKVVDVRRDLYLERSGFDMYGDENRVRHGK